MYPCKCAHSFYIVCLRNIARCTKRSILKKYMWGKRKPGLRRHYWHRTSDCLLINTTYLYRMLWQRAKKVDMQTYKHMKVLQTMLTLWLNVCFMYDLKHSTKTAATKCSSTATSTGWYLSKVIMYNKVLTLTILQLITVMPAFRYYFIFILLHFPKHGAFVLYVLFSI